MSGHSKWSTIKRQKETNDAARGKLFSKLSKAIAIAAKTGGGTNPETNYKLRIAIDQAKAANMPKANIERVLTKAGDNSSLEELKYEGFGPFGVSVILAVATDNKNRSAQEIKSIFDKNGGRLAGPGAVSFNFEPKGFVMVEKSPNVEEQMLQLIDLGVEDVEEVIDGIEIYVEPENLSGLKKALEKAGFSIAISDLIQKPKIYKKITDPKESAKLINLLAKLDDHEDVQKVFANADISQSN